MNKSKLVSNTQIYLDCRKLLDEILDITPNFPRAYKFSVGSRKVRRKSYIRNIGSLYKPG